MKLNHRLEIFGVLNFFNIFQNKWAKKLQINHKETAKWLQRNHKETANQPQRDCKQTTNKLQRNCKETAKKNKEILELWLYDFINYGPWESIIFDLGFFFMYSILFILSVPFFLFHPFFPVFASFGVIFSSSLYYFEMGTNRAFL